MNEIKDGYEYIIEADDVSYGYPDDSEDGKDIAVEHVSVKIRKGEYVCLLGQNGSGKSTLAKLFNLILVPDSGTLTIKGKKIDPDKLTDDDLFAIRKTIGMVFQNPDNQLVATIVEEDVAFGPENLGVPTAEIRKRVDDSLRLVGMSEYARTAPHMLSGGQKQRIAIAGIIAMLPECIVFDESTSMLDPQGRKDVLDIMMKLNRENGITVINITHFMEEAVMADRVYVMDDGKIVLTGTPKQVFCDVQTIRDCSLEPPPATELLHKLNKKGFSFPIPVFSYAECADLIAERVRDRKNG